MDEQPPTCQKSPTNAHYWRIDSAKGPTSKGVCKYCGAEKEFDTAFGYIDSGPEEKVIGRYRFRDPIHTRGHNVY